MKPKITLIILTFFLSLSFSCKKDNECVKQIAAIAVEGNKINKEFSSGKKELNAETYKEMFIMPNGNVFANEKIKAIIEENPNYPLDAEDKEILEKAVQSFKEDSQPEYNLSAASTLNELNSKAEINESIRAKRELNESKVQYNLSLVQNAKYLKDLLN